MTRATEIKLDSTQQAAVDSDAAAILLLASAGSGKTEVVVRRVEQILTKDPTARVLALSHTVKAAAELQSRFDSHLGALTERIRTDTLHGFAHGLLRKNGTWLGLPIEPDVYQRDEDRLELLGGWLAASGQVHGTEALHRILREIDTVRATKQPDTEEVRAWRSALMSVGAVDYGSMLELSVEILRKPSFRRQFLRDFTHVIVDEAQNLTPAQYELLTTLFGSADALGVSSMLVGDDKQSIVGFSGGDAKLLQTFATQYSAEEHHLANNYRSAKDIVQLGERVSGVLGNAGSAESPTYAASGSVEVSGHADETAEGRAVADWVERLLTKGLGEQTLAEGASGLIRPEQIAVLGRSASVLGATERELVDRSIEVAKAIQIDDWLVGLPGRIILELFGLKQTNASSSTLQLQRLLDTKDKIESTDDLCEHLATRSDALGPLAELCQVEDVASFMAKATQLELPDSPYWEDDQAQLQNAWSSFRSSTAAAARTWSNFRVYVFRVQRTSDLSAGVRLLTIHKSQGSEFKAVAIVGLNKGQFPDFRAISETEMEAELRTFYVAVSRPSRALLLTRSKSRMTRSGRRRTEPSGFLRYVTTAQRDS